MRKGQITVFIIIALLMVISVGIFYYFMQDDAGGIDALQRAPQWAVPVQNYVQECIEQTATAGVYLLAAQGGWTSHPDPALATEHMLVGYHVYNNQRTAPTTEEIRMDFAQFVDLALPACIDDFAPFKEFEIEQERPRSEVVIAQDTVRVRVDYPLTILKGGSETELDAFGAEVPIRLGRTLDTADTAVQRILEEPDRIILDRMSDTQMQINILPYDEHTLVYALRDPNSDVDDKPFVFFFASQTEGNTPPSFAFTPDFVLTRGKPFYYKVEAIDPDTDILRFSDSTQAFNIDPLTGEIAFTPMATGAFTVTVVVTDGKASATQQIHFEVEP